MCETVQNRINVRIEVWLKTSPRNRDDLRVTKSCKSQLAVMATTLLQLVAVGSKKWTQYRCAPALKVLLRVLAGLDHDES